MSFSDAISELLVHFDSVISSIPDAEGDKLPADVVVLLAAEKVQSGIGLVSREDAVNNEIIDQGLLDATLELVIWSDDNQDLVTRSRVLLIGILTQLNLATANGVIKKIKLVGQRGLEYYGKKKWWKLTIVIAVSFEYQYVESSGTGIIQEIPVTLENHTGEEFVVS